MKYGGYCLLLFFLKMKKMEEIENILKKIREVTSIQFQIFNAKFLISPIQIEAAFINALLSIEAGKNIAKNLALEVLLKMAADTQISNAIKKIGIKKSTKYLGLYLIGHSIKELEENANRILEKIDGEIVDENEILKIHKRKDILDIYNIKEKDIESIYKDGILESKLYLILEKMATSELYK